MVRVVTASWDIGHPEKSTEGVLQTISQLLLKQSRDGDQVSVHHQDCK